MKKGIFWIVCGLWVVMGMFACGGGGGNATSTTPAGTVVDLSVLKDFAEAKTAGRTMSFNVTGSIGAATNLTGVFLFTISAPTITSTPTGTQTVNVLVQNVQVSQPSTGSSASSTFTDYVYQTGFLYKEVNNDGTISTPISQTLLPASAKVGDTGDDMVLSNFDGSTETSTWRIDPGTNGDAIFVFTFTDRNTSNVVTQISEDAYTIKPDGSISAVSSIINDVTTGTTGIMSGNRN